MVIKLLGISPFVLGFEYLLDFFICILVEYLKQGAVVYETLRTYFTAFNSIFFLDKRESGVLESQEVHCLLLGSPFSSDFWAVYQIVNLFFQRQNLCFKFNYNISVSVILIHISVVSSKLRTS
jgi:hypothetical protein